MLGLAKYRVGSRIVTNVDIEIFPWDAEDGVAAGDHGEIIDVDPENGGLVIKMDRLISALDERGNYLFIPADRLNQIQPEVDNPSRWSTAKRASIFLSSVAAAIVLVSVFSVGAMATYRHMHPTIEIKKSVIENPLLSQGGTLTVRSYVHRLRQCASTISRMIRSSDGATVWRDTIISAPEGYDWGWKVFSIKLPDYLDPGTYSFAAEIVTQCDWMGSEVAYNPPAGQSQLRFVIEPH